jgi:hypothetical protein
MIRSILIITVFCLFGEMRAQVKNDTLISEPPYDRKEEIIYRNKRYRIHNNYLTVGAGAGNSTVRNLSQRALAIDFQFHIKEEHFQAGILMSGSEFLYNNHLQGHLCYGFRKESKATNLAVFIGPAYHRGVTGNTSTSAEFYNGFSAYACAQAVVKIAYDIGIGVELFNEYSARQNLFGFKLIVFFSGAYKGEKKNYNPNVRSERP